MDRVRATTVTILVLLVISTLLAATPAAAQGPRAATGFGGDPGGPPRYTITARADVCLIVFLLNSTGQVQYVRWGFLNAFSSHEISTGSALPVFAIYAPVAGGLPIFRCPAPGPSIADIVSDPSREPAIWMTVGVTPDSVNINVDQFNFAAIRQSAINASLCCSYQSNLQSGTIVQGNFSYNSVVAGTGVDDVEFAPAADLARLFTLRATTCGLPSLSGNTQSVQLGGSYQSGIGYGQTCNPSVGGGGVLVNGYIVQ